MNLRAALILLIMVSSYSDDRLLHAQQGEIRPYDGTRWTTLSRNEREAFVTGFTDCYSADYRGADRYSKSFFAYEQDVTAFYRNNPTKLNVSVSDVLHSLRDRAGNAPRVGGEVTIEKHGVLDGLFWRQMFAGGGPKEQAGFVDGYLSCNRQLAHNKFGTFSKTTSTYVRLISQWYRFDEKTGDDDEKRDDAKIADVVQGLRDPSVKGPQSSDREKR